MIEGRSSLDVSISLKLAWGALFSDAITEYFCYHAAEASAQKYGYAPRPEDYEATPVHVFRPRVVFAWTHLMKDATRWQFPNDAA
jgi:hypothetical protein